MRSACAGGDDYSKNAEAGFSFKAKNFTRAFALWEQNESYRSLALHTVNPVEKYKWFRVAQLPGQSIEKALDNLVVLQPRSVADQGEAAALAYYTKRYGKNRLDECSNCHRLQQGCNATTATVATTKSTLRFQPKREFVIILTKPLLSGLFSLLPLYFGFPRAGACRPK